MRSVERVTVKDPVCTIIGDSTLGKAHLISLDLSVDLHI